MNCKDCQVCPIIIELYSNYYTIIENYQLCTPRELVMVYSSSKLYKEKFNINEECCEICKNLRSEIIMGCETMFSINPELKLDFS